MRDGPERGRRRIFGLGPIIGPVGNFSTVPEASKWILSFLMLLGRLEILAVLVVFTPHFWTR